MNILDDIINGPALFDDNNLRLYERILGYNITSHAVSMGWLVGKHADEFDVSTNVDVIYEGFANYLNATKRMTMDRYMVTYFGNIPIHDIPWKTDFQSTTYDYPLACTHFGKYAFLSELHRNLFRNALEGREFVKACDCIIDTHHPLAKDYMVFARDMYIVRWSGGWSPETLLSLADVYHNHVTASLYD